MGKGKLIFKDHGKPVYTFILRPGSKGVRVVSRRLDDSKFPELDELRQKVFSGEATDADQKLFRKKVAEALQVYLAIPLEEAVDIEQVEMEAPDKARIFNSVVCAECGEKAMEPRARVRDGKIVCLPCADHYKSRI